jgi:hypothetical protein
MRLYAAVKIDRKTFVHIEVHKIYVPNLDEQGGYVQSLSLSAFAHNGDEDKNKGNWSPTHLYVVKRWNEFIEDAERWKEYNIDDRLLPTIEHNTVWDFYKHESYNYKKKKWMQK